MKPTGEPAFTAISLGAGVQSTTLLLLTAQGRLPHVDLAVFADTGWEPAQVYDHLNRIDTEIAQPAGIPIVRVTVGNIRDDALDPEHRFASMPLYILNRDGSDGMARRQCTSEYKLKPIKREIRRRLGYPHPTPVPRGVFADTWIGFSRDEWHRLRDSPVAYMRNQHPLIDLGWSRVDCERFLTRNGYPDTPKSACVGCPYHGNRYWRTMRDTQPDDWASAVDFDHAIRKGHPKEGHDEILGTAYLHRSRLPLDQAPVDRVTSAEWKTRQGDLFDHLADVTDPEEEEAEGCSPWGCRNPTTDP